MKSSVTHSVGVRSRRRGDQGVDAQLDAPGADRADDRAARAVGLRRDRDLGRARPVRRLPRARAAGSARSGVLGRGHADDGRARSVPRGPLRAPRQRRVRQGLPVLRRRPRWADPDARPVHGRQGRADGLAGRRVALVRGGAQGVPGARREGRRADRPRAAQPVRDLLPEPLRAGARAGRRRRAALRRGARHVPHEHRGSRPDRGHPRRGRPARGLPRRRQQPHAARHGALDWMRSCARSSRSATRAT